MPSCRFSGHIGSLGSSLIVPLNDISRRARFGEPFFQEQWLPTKSNMPQGADSSQQGRPDARADNRRGRSARNSAAARAFPGAGACDHFSAARGRGRQRDYGRFSRCSPAWNFLRRSKCSQKPAPSCARSVFRKKSTLHKDLAAHIRDGKLDFHRFPKMDDEEIIEHLVMVKGIGQWTAEMFLMFNLGSPDVMPAGDLGVQNAIKRHYRMRQRPNRKRLLEHAERWRHRTAAAWYMAQPRHRTPRRPSEAGNQESREEEEVALRIRESAQSSIAVASEIWAELDSCSPMAARSTCRCPEQG